MYWVDLAANAASDIPNFGLNRSGLEYYYYIGILCDGTYNYIPSISEINAAAANFPVGGGGVDFFVGDELNDCPLADQKLVEMGLNAHAANPSVKTILTLNTPNSDLYNEGDGRSAIDHWCSSILGNSGQPCPGVDQEICGATHPATLDRAILRNGWWTIRRPTNASRQDS